MFVSGKPIFFLQIVTPSSELYSKVDSVLSIQRLKMFSLLRALVLLHHSVTHIISKMEHNLKEGSEKKDTKIRRVIRGDEKLFRFSS